MKQLSFVSTKREIHKEMPYQIWIFFSYNTRYGKNMTRKELSILFFAHCRSKWYKTTGCLTVNVFDGQIKKLSSKFFKTAIENLPHLYMLLSCFTSSTLNPSRCPILSWKDGSNVLIVIVPRLAKPSLLCETKNLIFYNFFGDYAVT